MKIMLLGGNGYLGHKLSSLLIRKGHEVSLINEDQIYANAKIEFDIIVNLVGRYEKENTPRLDIIESNFLSGLRILDYAVEHKINNFITIDTALPENFNLYSFSKKQLSKWGKYYSSKYGITFKDIILQMFYGEDEPQDRFWVSCANKLHLGTALELTTGEQIRDIIYIDDVVEAITYIIEHLSTGYEEIQLGSGMAIPLKESIQYLKKISHSNSNLMWGSISSRVGEPDCIADLTEISKIGWNPKYNIYQGLEIFWNRYINLL